MLHLVIIFSEAFMGQVILVSMVMVVIPPTCVFKIKIFMVMYTYR